MANLVENTNRGHFKITTAGTEILSRPLTDINIKFLKQLPSFVESISKKEEKESNSVVESDPTKTPEEILAANFLEIRKTLSLELLSKVKSCTPAGIIQNKNVTELLKNVAKNFRTKKSETISEDSLRNKSYNYEARTVNEMKDVIIGLLNQVKRY